MKQGFEVLSVGREKSNSLSLSDKIYKEKRLKLIFEKGPLFYLEYNIRLFFFLLKMKPAVLLSNDLDTLPANAMVSLIKGIPLVYDSHEYFTEVPELIDRPVTRGIWKIIESFFIRKAIKTYTVSESIAKAYNKKYGVSFTVVRNMPEKVNVENLTPKSILTLPRKEGRKIILYQGSVNVDRGLEEMVAAMEFLPNCEFCVLGDGDIFNDLKLTISKVKWGDRIHFLGLIPHEDLPAITKQADLGISIEKKKGLSYTFALPNKVFDYVQVGLPVLMSDLPELVEINKLYEFGKVIDNHDPKKIAFAVMEMFDNNDVLEKLKSNALKAAEELNWEKELYKINEIFSDFLDQG